MARFITPTSSEVKTCFLICGKFLNKSELLTVNMEQSKYFPYASIFGNFFDVDGKNIEHSGSLLATTRRNGYCRRVVVRHENWWGGNFEVENDRKKASAKCRYLTLESYNHLFYSYFSGVFQ